MGRWNRRSQLRGRDKIQLSASPRQTYHLRSVFKPVEAAQLLLVHRQLWLTTTFMLITSFCLVLWCIKLWFFCTKMNFVYMEIVAF